jgi:hypothetical protein
MVAVNEANRLPAVPVNSNGLAAVSVNSNGLAAVPVGVVGVTTIALAEAGTGANTTEVAEAALITMFEFVGNSDPSV